MSTSLWRGLVTVSLFLCNLCVVYNTQNVPTTESGDRQKCECHRLKKLPVTSGFVVESSAPYQQHTAGVKAVCNNKQLSVFPEELPNDTTVLYFDHNLVTTLNRSMFQGLSSLVHLSLAYNKIESIDNDTFYDLLFLEMLDLNRNYLTKFSHGMLCPWMPTSACDSPFYSHYACQDVDTAYGKLSIRINYNRWHCTCEMQKILEDFSCASAAFDNVCVSFIEDRDKAIGYCASPMNMEDIPLGSLSSEDSASKKVNACSYRKTHIDIALLVTLLTWIGAVLGYVVYFVVWNNKDIANHRTYLTNLNSLNRSVIGSPKSLCRSRISMLDDTPRSRSRTNTMPLSTTLKADKEMARKNFLDRPASKSVEGTSSVWSARVNSSSQRSKSASPRPQKLVFKTTISPLMEESLATPDAASSSKEENEVLLSTM